MRLEASTWGEVERGQTVLTPAAIYTVGNCWESDGRRYAELFNVHGGPAMTRSYRRDERIHLLVPELGEALAMIRRELGDFTVISIDITDMITTEGQAA